MTAANNEGALATLRRDHAIIETFLDRFVGFCRLIEKEEPIAVSLQELVAFIENFIETFHHTREERVLFAHLRKVDVRQGYLGRRLTHDHEDGRHHVEGMRRVLELRNAEERASFLWNAMGYAHLSRDHLGYEERELYPHIATLISPEDDAALLAAFDALFPDSESILQEAETFVASLPPSGGAATP